MQEHAGYLTSARRGFLPHGFCCLWNPALLWTHLVAGSVATAAAMPSDVPQALTIIRSAGGAQ